MISNRPRHPLSLEIALVIVSTKLAVDDMEEAAFQTLQRIGDHHDWPDEYRAEIYGRIVENLPNGPMMPFLELQMVVSEALWDTGLV